MWDRWKQGDEPTATTGQFLCWLSTASMALSAFPVTLASGKELLGRIGRP